jgi:hypothetical protein
MAIIRNSYKTQFLSMIDELIVHTKKFTLKELKSVQNETTDYSPHLVMQLPKFIFN